MSDRALTQLESADPRSCTAESSRDIHKKNSVSRKLPANSPPAHSTQPLCQAVQLPCRQEDSQHPTRLLLRGTRGTGMQPVHGREELSKNKRCCWAAHGKAELAWGTWGCSSLPSQGLGDLCTKPPCSRACRGCLWGVTELGCTAPPRCAPAEQRKLQAPHTDLSETQGPWRVPGAGSSMEVGCWICSLHTHRGGGSRQWGPCLLPWERGTPRQRCWSSCPS